MGLEELKRLGIPVNTNSDSREPKPTENMVTVKVSIPVWNDIEVEIEVPEDTDDDEITEKAVEKALIDEPKTPWLVDEDRPYKIQKGDEEEYEV